MSLPVVVFIIALIVSKGKLPVSIIAALVAVVIF